MKFLLTSLFVSILYFAMSQNEEIYPFSADIEQKIDTSSSNFKYQIGGTEYSFIGKHQKALLTYERERAPKIYVPIKEDSTIMNDFSVENGRNYILEQSKKEKIVIINEAHHIPNHRIFTQSLLAELYQNGYRYLGLEAITDEEINTRNFATTESGYYTNEPSFGNLIYEARKIGFTIFGYEANSENMNSGRERDSAQAKNIQHFMEANPNGKVLIHCGYQHVYENNHSSWGRAMAGRVKDFTGIDPFTIDQTIFIERSSSEFSHIFSRIESPFPFVFMKGEKPLNSYRGAPQQVDVILVHPMTKYVNERPHWIAENKFIYTLEKEPTKQIVQVLAYRVGEHEKNGVPVDIVEYSSDSPIPLYLPAGEYRIIIKDSDRTIIKTVDVTIGKE